MNGNIGNSIMIAWWALSAGLAIVIYTLIDKKHVNNPSGKKNNRARRW
ncbi:MAG: hypothetical protein WCH00_02190 [Candidatus Saccharibacteria bacterium]